MLCLLLPFRKTSALSYPNAFSYCCSACLTHKSDFGSAVQNSRFIAVLDALRPRPRENQPHKCCTLTRNGTPFPHLPRNIPVTISRFQVRKAYFCGSGFGRKPLLSFQQLNWTPCGCCPSGCAGQKVTGFRVGTGSLGPPCPFLQALSTAYPANPQLAPISRPITPDSSNGSDVVLTGQLPHPACHFKFKKRRKHFRGRKLCLQLFQDSVDLEAVVGAQDFQHHHLLWS